MEWFKLAANYADDPKIVAVGEQAELLFIRALAYCARAETAGKLTRTSLERLGFARRMRRVEALVKAGLWTEVEDGWQITRWAEWQSELDALAARRHSDRERKRAQRERAAAAKADFASRDNSRDTSRDKEGSSRDGHVTVTPGEGEGEKPTYQNDPRPPAPTVPGPRSGGRENLPKPTGTDITHEAEAIALLAALEPARLRPGRRIAEALAADIAQLLALGWPADQLRQRMTENAPDEIRSIGGFLRSRLPEPTRYRNQPAQHNGPPPIPAWCGKCEEPTRLIDTGHGFSRCPACHPMAQAGKETR